MSRPSIPLLDHVDTAYMLLSTPTKPDNADPVIIEWYHEAVDYSNKWVSFFENMIE